MNILGPLIFAGLILLGVFSWANWSLLTAPGTLSLAAFSVNAPLGLVLLGALLAFVALFSAYVLILRTAMLMDAHRHARELKAQQQLAEQAEASRLSELRSQLDREFAQLREAAEQSRISLGVQVEGMQQALRNAMEESSRGLSAHIGEVEDKLDRSLTQATHDK